MTQTLPRPHQKQAWTEVKRFVDGEFAVIITRTVMNNRSAYSLRLGKPLEDGTITLAVPLRTDTSLVTATLRPFVSRIGRLLEEADAWLSTEIETSLQDEIDRRLAREKSQADYGKPVTRITGKTAKKKAKRSEQGSSLVFREGCWQGFPTSSMWDERSDQSGPARDESMSDVTVLDATGRIVSPVGPARARILVRDGDAIWESDNVLRLKRDVRGGSDRSHVSVTNFLKFFNQERDIYIQNIANAQISLEFETAGGSPMGFLVPQSRDPLNLTQAIPWDVIKNSNNFRKMLNRQPKVLEVLTEEEYNAYYAKRAAVKGVAPEAAIGEANARQQGMQNKTSHTVTASEKMKPLHQVIMDDLKGKKVVSPASDEVVSSEEVINPRVLHICNQVSIQIDDKEKMKPAEMLQELEMIESELTLDDFSYVRSHGYWKSVMTWAKEGEKRMAGAGGEGAPDPE